MVSAVAGDSRQPAPCMVADLPPLTHYSKKKLVITHTPRLRRGDEPPMKPTGLWVSDDADQGWAEWCRNEDFRLDELAHAHAVTLVPDALLLWLRTEADLFWFTDVYADLTLNKQIGINHRMWIRWDQVAEDYQGLVITPYHWRVRMDQRIFWYYSWDCASGCIWDYTAIDSVTLRKQAK